MPFGAVDEPSSALSASDGTWSYHVGRHTTWAGWCSVQHQPSCYDKSLQPTNVPQLDRQLSGKSVDAGFSTCAVRHQMPPSVLCRGADEDDSTGYDAAVSQQD